MKKVLFAAIAVLALASCKKEATCKYPLLPSVKYNKADYSDSELAAYKESCVNSVGTWSDK